MDVQRPCQDRKLFHLYKKTNKYGAWVKVKYWKPKNKDPVHNARVFIGAYITFDMAARMQDRALCKTRPNGPFNFKASDYDEDKELRRNMSTQRFLQMLRDENRKSYKVVEKSECYLKFGTVEEELNRAEKERKQARSRDELKARKEARKQSREGNSMADYAPPISCEVTEEVTEAAVSLLSIFQAFGERAKSAPISRNVGADAAEGSGEGSGESNKRVTRSAAKKSELASSSATSFSCSVKGKEPATTVSIKRRRS